jgi:hypothetical protein
MWLQRIFQCGFFAAREIAEQRDGAGVEGAVTSTRKRSDLDIHEVFQVAIGQIGRFLRGQRIRKKHTGHKPDSLAANIVRGAHIRLIGWGAFIYVILTAALALVGENAE